VRLYAERYHGFNAIYASVRSLSSSRSQADLTRAILTRADFGVLSVSTALRRECALPRPLGSRPNVRLQLRNFLMFSLLLCRSCA